jgi:hypothetical protein
MVVGKKENTMPSETSSEHRLWEFDADERGAWNRRYSEQENLSFEPDPFLLEAYEHFASSLFPKAGSALDIAGGLGRHAIWLAE